LYLSDPPPQAVDTFTFSQRIWHQVAGLALVGLQLVSAWERVVDLQFARRPGDEVLWHLYIEIMGKYSNAILVNSSDTIVTALARSLLNRASINPVTKTEGDLETANINCSACPPVVTHDSLQGWDD
jgi:predicted ribosome quality control (RQC) complex YloA/Tae2 family protein